MKGKTNTPAGLDPDSDNFMTITQVVRGLPLQDGIHIPSEIAKLILK